MSSEDITSQDVLIKYKKHIPLSSTSSATCSTSMPSSCTTESYETYKKYSSSTCETGTEETSYETECDSVSYIYEGQSDQCHKKICNRRNFNTVDVCVFRTIITPLSSLTPVNSRNPGPIEFRMRRKNKVVTLQWEPFSGIITTTGISFLMMAQTICNMPPYPVWGVYNIVYNGVNRLVPIEVNPNTVKSNLLFYLNANATAENVNANDSVIVHGGSLAWVVI